MTIDERLDKLTERHEALAQSVELLYARQRDNEERWENRFGQVMNNFEVVLDSIKRLENIAAAHQQRRDDLEH
jgi:hypothetical protein